MEGAESFMDAVLSGTNASRVFTYPGSPPRYLFKAVVDSDAELVQGVSEQHLLHLAQTHYYARLEGGVDEIPVVIVSGEMGEAMLFQPLIAGSITAPCLIIVAEGGFPHIENAINIDHQTDRGFTPEKLADYQHVLTEHENVDVRMFYSGEEDLDRIEELIRTLRADRAIGIVHVPVYSHAEVDDRLATILADRPETVSLGDLGTRWAAAERPLLLIGRGCKHPETRDRIQAIARERGATITTTLQMDGYFTDNYAGRIGPMGTPSANEAFYRSDLVVVLGASVKNTVTSFDPDAVQAFRDKAVQIEHNPQRRSMLVGAWCDGTLDDALDVLTGVDGESWFDEPFGTDEQRTRLPPLVRRLGELLREEYPDKVVNFGVGNSMLWLPYALGPTIRKEVSRSGSMGEAVAGLNREENPVIVLGDGEFEMDLSLITEAQYQGTGATIFVLNNERLGLVTEPQAKEFGDVLTPKLPRPIDYDRLGDAFTGVTSFSASTPDEVTDVFRRAMETEQVAIVEITVDDELDPIFFDPFTLPRLD